jgi:hypothetical protein
LFLFDGKFFASKGAEEQKFWILIVTLNIFFASLLEAFR